MIQRIAIVAVLGSVLAAGCHKKSDDAASPPPAPAKVADQPPTTAPAPSGARGDRPLSLPDGIPASAVIVGAIEAPSEWVEQAASWGVFDAKVAQDAVADVDAYLVKTTGISVSKIYRAAFFVTADGKPAALIASVGGEWKGPPPGKAKIAMHGAWMIIGEPSAVDLAVATADGKSPSLAKDSVLAKLFERESKGAVAAAAVDVSQLPAEARAKAATFGVERAALSIGSQLRVVAEGKADGLASLAKLYDMQTGIVVETFERQRAAAMGSASLDTGPQPEMLGIIVGSHFLRAAVQLAQPKLDGNALRVTINLPGNAATLVPMIGVMSAVAIPAFMQYMHRADAMRAAP